MSDPDEQPTPGPAPAWTPDTPPITRELAREAVRRAANQDMPSGLEPMHPNRCDVFAPGAFDHLAGREVPLTLGRFGGAAYRHCRRRG